MLGYLRLAHKGPISGDALRIALVTNFTDDLLKKTLAGMCAHEGIAADIYATPYKQHIFALKDASSPLFSHAADITFVFLQANPYRSNEFTEDPDTALSVLDDVAAYAGAQKGHVIVATIPPPSHHQHGRVLASSELGTTVATFNEHAAALARDIANVELCDSAALVRSLGERRSRDLRGLYAFDQPWSHDFVLALAQDWMTRIRTRAGKIRKCIVLDLDNTLWGGVVGETGPLGIALGPEYPGNAYLEFQRTLKALYERGIILAIASRNNLADVEEAFAKNPHMVLSLKHFASIEACWDDKPTMLRRIAADINIGLDSLIFIDDDALNRDQVRTELPEVLVPEWSFPPEEYVHALLDLDAFHPGTLTAEDAERGAMYAQERERKAARTKAPDLDAYLASLQIGITMTCNDAAAVPRIAQLTQKTNQFNLSTMRMRESEVSAAMQDGLVYLGDVRDTFGAYGQTILAIIRPDGSRATMETFLMSCRVMGRKVEDSFFRAVAEDIAARGIKTLSASFTPTKKNPPAADFLSRLGCAETGRNGETVLYELDLGKYLAAARSATLPARVTLQP